MLDEKEESPSMIFDEEPIERTQSNPLKLLEDQKSIHSAASVHKDQSMNLDVTQVKRKVPKIQTSHRHTLLNQPSQKKQVDKT